MITANSVCGILSRTAISTLGANWLLMIPSTVTSLMVVYAITISCPEDDEYSSLGRKAVY